MLQLSSMEKTNEKDKKLREWLKQGGREEVKKDFLKVLKKASTPQKPSKP